MLGQAFKPDKVFSAECGSLNRSAELLFKRHDLSLHGEVVDHPISNRDHIVGDERTTGQQERRTTDQHVHPRTIFWEIE